MAVCGCIERIREGLKDKCFQDAESISCEAIEVLSGKTYSDFSVKLPMEKKEKRVPVFHRYCPWCGKEYNQNVRESEGRA